MFPPKSWMNPDTLATMPLRSLQWISRMMESFLCSVMGSLLSDGDRYECSRSGANQRSADGILDDASNEIIGCCIGDLDGAAIARFGRRHFGAGIAYVEARGRAFVDVDNTIYFGSEPFMAPFQGALRFRGSHIDEHVKDRPD